MFNPDIDLLRKRRTKVLRLMKRQRRYTEVVNSIKSQIDLNFN